MCGIIFARMKRTCPDPSARFPTTTAARISMIKNKKRNKRNSTPYTFASLTVSFPPPGPRGNNHGVTSRECCGTDRRAGNSGRRDTENPIDHCERPYITRVKERRNNDRVTMRHSRTRDTHSSHGRTKTHSLGPNTIGTHPHTNTAR